MKAYVVTTGLLFVLVIAMHLWRAWVEGWALASNPAFTAGTLISAGLALWAWRVFRQLRSM